MKTLQDAVAAMSVPQQLNFAVLLRQTYTAQVSAGTAKLDPKHLRMLDAGIKRLRAQLEMH